MTATARVVRVTRGSRRAAPPGTTWLYCVALAAICAPTEADAQVAAPCEPLERVAVPLDARALERSSASVASPPAPTQCVSLPPGATVERIDGGARAAPIVVGGRQATVIALLARASGGSHPHDVSVSDLPRSVVVRARAGGHRAFRLTVNACLERMVEAAERELEQHGERLVLRPEGATSAASRRCDARLELVPTAGAAASEGPTEVAVRFGDVRVRVALADRSAARTPLQARFRSPAHAPLFEWAFDRDGMTLAPRATSGEVDELLLAAGSSALQWRAGDAAERGAVECTDEAHVRVPEGALRRALRRRYGPVVAAAPTPEDVAAAAEELQLCLVDHYPDPSRAASPADAQTCLALAGWIAAPHEPGAGVTVHLEHGVRQLTDRDDPPLDLVSDPQHQVRLAPGAADRWLPYLATTGDRLVVRGPRGSLSFCVGGQCAPPGPDGAFTLTRSGVGELRRARDLGAASTFAAVTLLRVLVIDPLREWIPVGLARAAVRPEVPVWWQLDRDDARTYAFVRGAMSAASRWQSLTQPEVMPERPSGEGGGDHHPITATVPPEDSSEDRRRTPPTSRLVTLATREARCPDATPESARRSLVAPDSLALDDTFYLFLAEYRGEHRAYRCLAMARLRVREARTLASLGATRSAVLGDPMILVYALPTAPGIGVGLPLAYFHVVLPRGVGLDAAVVGTASWSISQGTLDRTGLAVTSAATWGIPGVAPRLVSFGVITHLLHADVDGLRAPAWSPFVGLNLGAVFEAARPR